MTVGNVLLPLENNGYQWSY